MRWWAASRPRAPGRLAWLGPFVVVAALGVLSWLLDADNGRLVPVIWLGVATIGLFVVMLIVFQAVFAWATPFMDLIDESSAALAALVHARFGDGWLASLIADGVIAGVGSVVIFLQ